MERYFAAKAALFEQAAIAVINVSGPYGARLAAQLPDAVTFDAGSNALEGVDLRLRGGFNRENAIAAVLAARALGLPEEAIRRGVGSLSGVPGRFEEIIEGQSFTVIVDYAHTPEALERVIEAARPLGEGRLTVVFGAGGGRDTAKRPLMGAVVAALAERGIVTSDNPRDEDPAAIVAQVAGRSARLERELDRRGAIERALCDAEAGDVIVIAGRGAEATQEIAGERRPFDDRDVARAILRRQVNAA
jgi:UDP-N-acetylmuramoyl-L-alanyl-D-glutamate--2,6-diaminopimelate ligase